jgi:hypothetical protein
MAEPSEGFFAGCALCTNEELNSADDDEASLNKFYQTMYSRYTSGSVIGNGNVKNDFLKEITLPPNAGDTVKAKFYSDLAVGISAVRAVRSFMSSKSTYSVSGSSIPSAVYMTGTQWPAQVQQFKFAAFGMADYNSSDVILQYGNVYVGVSLKKKPKATAPSPTLINKAFDTVLNGPQFATIKSQLQQARQQFFGNVIKEALTSGPLVGLAQLPDGSDPRNASAEQLWNTKIKIKKNGKDTNVSLINLKETGMISNSTLLNPEIPVTNANAMRDYVNKKLGKVGDNPNTLYKQFLSIIQANQKIFADTLINLILKRDLQDEMSQYTQNNFEFLLVTGVGNATSNKTSGTKIAVGGGECIGMDSIGLALAALRKAPKKIEIDKVKTSTSNAAKLYFKVKAGSMELLDLELRYKGDFMSQPQFQAFLATDLKGLLMGTGQFANAKKILSGR